MARLRMHADEIHTDAELVRRLLSGQFPQWATLPAVLVPSFGTDHDIYRLGERLSVRLPRIGCQGRALAAAARASPAFGCADARGHRRTGRWLPLRVVGA